jgi:hypothetical protein
MSIELFNNPLGRSARQSDTPYFATPKKGFCDFWASNYKEYVYPYMKSFTNLPGPNECPIKKVSNFNISGNFRSPLNVANLRVNTKYKDMKLIWADTQNT